MNKWYETAVFYHIYPLGLCGAPRENKGEGVEHRLPGPGRVAAPHSGSGLSGPVHRPSF